METTQERKDFSEWAVTAKYQAQDGVCINCGGSLEKGFHRHHIDGDHSNNKIENLELRCAECHRATFAKEGWEAHKGQEKLVLGKLNDLIDATLNKQFPGSTLERALDAVTMSLKVSRSINQLDKGIEYPPASIQALKRMLDGKLLEEKVLDGFTRGLENGSQLVSQQAYELGYRDAEHDSKKSNTSRVESPVAS